MLSCTNIVLFFTNNDLKKIILSKLTGICVGNDSHGVGKFIIKIKAFTVCYKKKREKNVGKTSNFLMFR